MSMKRAIGRSVVWNAAGLVVEAVTGFLVMPFLIIKLGQATYGVWIVLGALTSYFGLLDLGLRGALGRYVAFHRSSGNQEGVNQTLTVGLTVLTVVGSVVVTVVVVCEPLFFRLFTVPADEHGAGRTVARHPGRRPALPSYGRADRAATTGWGLRPGRPTRSGPVAAVARRR